VAFVSPVVRVEHEELLAALAAFVVVDGGAD
jgi:hypothetical protein